MEYDTREIRNAARRVGNVANEISGVARSQVTSAINMIPGHFEGEAAEVLSDNLSDFKSDLVKLGKGLSKIREELMDYADRLDEMDRRAAQAIKSN